MTLFEPDTAVPVLRTVAATFATVAAVLCITFIVITVEVRDRVRRLGHL